MNYFENEIMRRVKELDCSAVYREHNDEISVMYDGVRIPDIRYSFAEKTPGITDEKAEKFLHIKRLCANVSNYCAAYENGKPIKIPDFSDGYRVIYRVGGAEMAARYDRTCGRARRGSIIFGRGSSYDGGAASARRKLPTDVY